MSDSLPIVKLKDGQTIDDIVTFKRTLGKGVFGEVFLAKQKKDGKVVAVKKQIFDKKTTATIMNEASALYAAMKHGCNKFVCEIYDIIIDTKGGFLYIIMEYLDGPTLKELLYSQHYKVTSDAEAMALIEPLIDGLICLHEAGIAHRDIKLDNVVVTAAGPKWIDLGLSCLKRCEGIAGNLGTKAPEVIYDPQSKTVDQWIIADWWSLGCMIYEIVMRKMLPFQLGIATASKNKKPILGEDQVQYELKRGQKMVSEFYNQFNSADFPEVYDILTRTLIVDPIERRKALLVDDENVAGQSSP